MKTTRGSVWGFEIYNAEPTPRDTNWNNDNGEQENILVDELRVTDLK